MIHFGSDNFIVTLEWSQFSGETYSVATVPEAVYTSFTGNTSVQFVMLYNTHAVQFQCYCNTVWTQECNRVYNNILLLQ